MDATFEALQDSADAPPNGYCGAPPDGEGNYTHGYGFLNVYEAGLALCLDRGLEGDVTEHGSGDPIGAADVVAFPEDPPYTAISASTSSSGYYRMELPIGTYRVIANSSVHHAEWVSGIEIDEVGLVRQDFELVHLDEWCDQFSCFYLPLVVKR
jgi:hypothetical protein